MPGPEFHEFIKTHPAKEVADFLVAYNELQKKYYGLIKESTLLRKKGESSKTKTGPYAKKRKEAALIKAKQVKMIKSLDMYAESDAGNKKPVKLNKKPDVSYKQLRQQLADSNASKEEVKKAIKAYQLKEKKKKYSKAGFSGLAVRASELDSPAPVGHFLSEFGQSDR